MSETPPARRARPAWPRRALVGALIVSGAVGLRALDRLAERAYRSGVDVQSVQAAAALEGALAGRVARIHALQGALADAPDDAERRERFHVIAGEIQQSAPDVQFQYLIDTAGVVEEVHVADPAGAPSDEARLRVAGSSEAFRAARDRRAPQLSTTVPLRGGGVGLVVYDAIVSGDAVIGYVGAGFSYASLFRGSLARELEGTAAYRVVDEAGQLVTASTGFGRASARSGIELLARPVTLPGGRRWRLEYLVDPRQPVALRTALWLVGIALLVALVVVAVNEERREESAALHTLRLEGLSRDLLDANLRLEERAQQVSEANRAKSRFLAHVSHELRTPLNAILGYNGLALEGVYGPLPSQLADAHARIRVAATHLLGVVDSVLDLSKLELSRLEVELTAVRVDALLADIAAAVESGADAKSLRVDVVVERSVPALQTDARHLRTALLAIATNAIKFTDAGAVTLAASVDAASSAVVIAVEDTGPGIAPEDHERIFEEFEQVRPAGRGDSIARGAGLGLAVARKLVRLLGGDVRVVSALGAGARFVVTLPIAARGPVPAAARP